ncbi:penicillin-binding protein [Candidatus Peregrinibacteria bacterium]|nr:penicillin-binding protein [Candidatus Peregrinibacteria bacterium]
MPLNLLTMFKKPFQCKSIGFGETKRPFRARATRETKPLWSWIKPLFFWGIVAGFVLGVIFVVVTIIQLPDIGGIQSLVPYQSSVILDRAGNPLYVIHGEENRTNVPLDKISPSIISATLAIEDDQFYQHAGFDVGGILKALCHEVYICSERRGGSTITQQFVKNAFLSNERSYSRKLKELILAIQLESRFTKDQILAMYLNRIPYGSNTFGVERAANTFFNKSAAGLTLAEASILAAIPKGPTYYSPYGQHVYSKFEISPDEIVKHGLYDEKDLDPYWISNGLVGKRYDFTDDQNKVHSIYLKGRTDFVLDRMKTLGLVTDAEKTQALQELSTLVFKPYREEMKAPHFVEYARQILEAKYGKESMEKGGLRITTTLDPDLQAVAEKSVSSYAEMNESRYKVSNESLLAMDPVTGQVLAMVGSRDYWNADIQGKVNMTLRPRLPGSSFKPIVYAAAFMQSYAPSTVVYDVKTKFGDTYEPEDYDGKERGPVSFRQALGQSLNIPAVKAAYLAGVSNVLSLARTLGLNLNQPDDWYGLSLALGAGEVRLIDLVGAYSVFDNGGYRVSPVVILKVEDKDGNILDEYTPPAQREQILDPQIAYLVTNVLSDAEARPEGFWRDQLTLSGRVNAVKTGTSNKQKKNPHYNPSNPDSKRTINVPFDTWTVGYTPRIAAGVWAGNADGTELGFSADGLGAASRIWYDFMMAATNRFPREEFSVPPDIKWIKVSKLSGKLPSEFTPSDMIVNEVFASFAPPKQADDSYQVVTIDTVSKKLATEYTPPEATAKIGFYVHHSILPNKPQWEDPVQKWVAANIPLNKIPTEYDNVHTPETLAIKPDIQIVSPTVFGTVTPPQIGARVRIQSVGGIKKVEYTWDGELMDTALVSPYSGTIRLPQLLEEGSKHIIGAKVYDSLYRTGFSSIDVVIGSDTMPPEVRFIYPKTADRFPVGSVISIQVDALDSGSDVDHVDFYLDGVLSGTVTQAPYLTTILISRTSGERLLKAIAFDRYNNKKSAEVSILAIDPGIPPSESRLLFPASGATISAGQSVVAPLFITPNDRRDLQSILLITKEKRGMPVQVAQIKAADSATAYYTLVWPNAVPGHYELYAKMIVKGGGVRFSQKVSVLVR